MALRCAQLITLKVMLEVHVVHDSTRQLPLTTLRVMVELLVSHDPTPQLTTLKVVVELLVFHDPAPQLTTLKVELKCYLVLAFVRVCERTRLYFLALGCYVFKCITFKKETAPQVLLATVSLILHCSWLSTR